MMVHDKVKVGNRYIMVYENRYYGFFGKVYNDTVESESDNRYTYIHIMVFVMTF